MKGSLFNPNYAHSIAEGSTKPVVKDIKDYISDPAQTFVRMIILETVSDPSIIDEEKISYWKNVIGVVNSRFAKVLPRNTVIAQRLSSGATQTNPPMFLFPFFPSHLAMPCKPGEMVWAMFEDPNAKIKEMGYWFCRITEPHIIDDVNHTHHAAQLDGTLSPGTAKKFEGDDQPIYELRNGKVKTKKDGSREVVIGSELIPTEDEEVFEKLVTETDGAKMHTYEAVPRFKKRPGDVVLEGSNNALIVLGTDRVGPIAKYDDAAKDASPPEALRPEPPETDVVGHAGTIDMVVGRGTDVSTNGFETSFDRFADGEPLFRTVSKSEKDQVKGEGDPDLVNDRSRILISQRTNPDTNFQLAEYMNGLFGIKDTGTDASIVIKSDKVRVVARSDISFIVTGYSDAVPLDDEDGESVFRDDKAFKLDNFDLGQWASITIKTSGDIVFTPSLAGVIKLGGDDADKALVCTNFVATNVDGEVKALPIATTAGGFIGVSGGNIDKEAVDLVRAPDLGKIATKVLIK